MIKIMVYDLDFYIMIMHWLNNDNTLILSRKILLTFLLVLFSIGSYTYSGIRIHLTLPSSITSSQLILHQSHNTNSAVHYLTPVSYLTNSKRKIKKIAAPSEMIMATGLLKSSALANFLWSRNKKIDYSYAQTLAKLYIEEANHEGVNPDIAFAQMCLETGFLRFDGVVDKHQNNFCGLGVTGMNNKGLSFKNIRDGVRAHIQHLKAYASTGKVSKKLVDTRFNFVKRGSAKDITGLTGKWATDKKYDLKIRKLLNKLYKPKS